MGKEYNPIAPEISGTSSVVSSAVCSTPTEENNGMICVSCHGPIHGFRYKCVTCAKYDLCSRHVLNIRTELLIWKSIYSYLHILLITYLLMMLYEILAVSTRDCIRLTI
jgi:hypothetical protein